MTESLSLNVFRNHDAVSKFRVRKDYTMTFKYCQITDLVLPFTVIDYYITTVPEEMVIEPGIVKPECYSSLVRYQNGAVVGAKPKLKDFEGIVEYDSETITFSIAATDDLMAGYHNFTFEVTDLTYVA